MDTCLDCQMLGGQPSSVTPHPYLIHRAVVHYGAGSGRQRAGTIWLCMQCGSTMRQSTHHDKEFPDSWNFGSSGFRCMYETGNGEAASA